MRDVSDSGTRHGLNSLTRPHLDFGERVKSASVPALLSLRFGIDLGRVGEGRQSECLDEHRADHDD